MAAAAIAVASLMRGTSFRDCEKTRLSIMASYMSRSMEWGIGNSCGSIGLADEDLGFVAARDSDRIVFFAILLAGGMEESLYHFGNSAGATHVPCQNGTPIFNIFVEMGLEKVTVMRFSAPLMRTRAVCTLAGAVGAIKFDAEMEGVM